MDLLTEFWIVPSKQWMFKRPLVPSPLYPFEIIHVEKSLERVNMSVSKVVGKNLFKAFRVTDSKASPIFRKVNNGALVFVLGTLRNEAVKLFGKGLMIVFALCSGFC